MKYEDGVLHLHQSDLCNLRMCPEQTRLKLTGEYFDPSGDSAMIGTQTHSFIEFCLFKRKNENIWPEPEALQQKVDELQVEWAQMWEDNQIWQHPHQIESMEQGQAFIEQACLNWWANCRPAFDDLDPTDWLIEHDFDYHLGWVGSDCECGECDRTEVRLRGQIDFFASACINDWKTSKAASGYNLWKLERYDIQSYVYAWAIQQELGFIPNFIYHHMARGTDEYKFNLVEATQANIDAMKQEIMSWAQTIVTMGTEQEWPKGPADWWCSSRWCSHHARGLCVGSVNQIFPEDAVNLTRLMK